MCCGSVIYQLESMESAINCLTITVVGPVNITLTLTTGDLLGANHEHGHVSGLYHSRYHIPEVDRRKRTHEVCTFL